VKYQKNLLKNNFRIQARSFRERITPSEEEKYMLISTIRHCQCAVCRAEADHPDKKLHHQINLLVSELNEQQRRWFVAFEASRIGRGGVSLMSLVTGMDEKTIHRGQVELEEGLAGRPKDRVRLVGGGRRLLQNRPAD